MNKLYFENEFNFLKRMEKLLIDSFKDQNIAEDDENSEICHVSCSCAVCRWYAPGRCSAQEKRQEEGFKIIHYGKKR